MLNWNLHSFKLLEIIQVLDSISWVRCASGNVFAFTNNQGLTQPPPWGETWPWATTKKPPPGQTMQQKFFTATYLKV